MKSIWKRTLSGLLMTLLLLNGCATPEAQRGPETVGRGLVNLMLAPFMIVSGLAQGLAFLPYTIGTSLDDLNRGLVEAQAVSLEDSYRATYGVSITDARVDRQSGQVSGGNFAFGQYRPEAMLDATKALQRLLVSQGMPQEKANHYAIVGDYTHTRTRGHILVAVVYRQSGMEPFRVVSKQTGIVTTLRPEQMGWRAPYERDVNGQSIDEVIDWVGLEYAMLRQDKVVATLMVLAAESIKSGKRSPDYWQAEKRWMAGESSQVMTESTAKVKRSLSAS